jgi:hypothetical protein
MSSWEKVNVQEIIGSAIIAGGVGVIRFLMLVRKARRVRFVDVVLEPSIAIFAGMCAWALSEAAGTPDVLQSVVTSVGAWSGPRLIHNLEKKYFGGTRDSDDTGRGGL